MENCNDVSKDAEHFVTEDQMRDLINQPNNIRNVTIISSLHAGKSTLLTLLQTKSISIKSWSENLIPYNSKPVVSPLIFEFPSESQTLFGHVLINCIDSTHYRAEYSDKQYDNSSIRVTDDVIEGTHNNDALFSAFTERVVPALIFNKMDLALEMPSEAAYQLLDHQFKIFNYQVPSRDVYMGDIQVNIGTVGFFSTLHGWGFTLNQFAEKYYHKFELDKLELVEKLWGDNYFDEDTQQWITQPLSTSRKLLSRSFCKYVLEPIAQVYQAVLSGNQQNLDNILNSIGVALSNVDKTCSGENLLKRIMQSWLPAYEAFVQVALKLPSPIQAQKYRVNNLYTGPQDDTTADGIKSCNPEGNLVVYISKLVTAADRGRFVAVGRVFSGTLKEGEKVRILGPNYQHGTKEDLFIKAVGRVTLAGCSAIHGNIPAGNMVHIYGIDQFIIKTATITADASSYPIFTETRDNVNEVTSIAVTPKDPKDLNKVAQIVGTLNKIDALTTFSFSDTGELVITGPGEQFLQIVLRDIQEEYLPGVELVPAKPMVTLKETVLKLCDEPVTKISPNKHNKLTCIAQPLEANLVEDIKQGYISSRQDPTQLSKQLAELHGWKLNEASNIWAFGPDCYGPNLLVNATTNTVTNMKEIKDSVVAAFQWVTKEGVLAAENMHGVRFDIIDCTLHSDAVHRGGGQIIPTARRAFNDAQIAASARFMEPVYQMEISCHSSSVALVYQVINRRGGQIIEEQVQGNVATVKFYLPVLMALDVEEELKKACGSRIGHKTVHHWKMIPDDPFMKGTRSHELVVEVRTRKGMSLPQDDM